jgi:hypothetical protein
MLCLEKNKGWGLTNAMLRKAGVQKMLKYEQNFILKYFYSNM